MVNFAPSKLKRSMNLHSKKETKPIDSTSEGYLPLITTFDQQSSPMDEDVVMEEQKT